MNNSKYLYCYSRKLYAYLTRKGHRYLCIGINDKTDSRFWLYEKDGSLAKSVDEYFALGGAAHGSR